MDIPVALLLVLAAALAAGGVLVWLARHDRRALITFVVALVPGAVAGAVILDQSQQPGIASLNGTVAALGLGIVVVGILIIGAVVRRLRTPAVAVSVSLVLSAVFASQLLVYLSRR